MSDQTIAWKPGYSPKEAAATVAVSEWTIWDELRKGNLHAKKRGRRTIITGESLRDLFNSLPDATYAPPVEKGKVG
jgi:hypothetical protein